MRPYHYGYTTSAGGGGGFVLCTVLVWARMFSFCGWEHAEHEKRLTKYWIRRAKRKTENGRKDGRMDEYSLQFAASHKTPKTIIMRIIFIAGLSEWTQNSSHSLSMHFVCRVCHQSTTHCALFIAPRLLVIHLLCAWMWMCIAHAKRRTNRFRNKIHFGVRVWAERQSVFRLWCETADCRMPTACLLACLHVSVLLATWMNV